jgi:hypothetical protein
MKKIFSLAVVMLALVSFCPVASFAQEPPTADFQQSRDQFIQDYTPVVDNALEAYNNEDAKAFYKDFASALASIATEDAFKAMYVKMYKDKFGKFVSKELIKESSSVSQINALLVYRAKFEKKDNIQISVNFMKEGDAFKIMQLRFDEVQQ